MSCFCFHGKLQSHVTSQNLSYLPVAACKHYLVSDPLNK